MSQIKSRGPVIPSRTAVAEQSRRIRGKPAGKGDHPLPEFIDKESLDTLSRFGEKFRLAGIEGEPWEFHELTVFNAFLEAHVRPNSTQSVQCMLLWSKWVRVFQRQTSGFPKLIREKEFSAIIRDTFGVAIANNDAQGKIFPGIKFVP
ncbi:hypothetical protein Mboo_0317 [Methanoregula boonei 6A8]|uniref:Uncharacterized protein n=1 Tax=Methanoregula boonei (strain DSM 21154 / JCM 14090 / 6A8) TaxID=456442 RepID=A7I528_METB6|nr:hypothetical protein Mboo_0317 [Methanoregula boonei 6A8]